MSSTINASTASGGGIITSADASGVLALQTGGTTAVTIDASQNVGIGVTPSAWYSGYKAVQINGLAVSCFNYTDAVFFKNTVFSPSAPYNTRIAAGYAQCYTMDGNGGHSWDIAPTGAAGSTIAFTKAMTIDSSGNVGIGTTSPNVKLHISGTSAGIHLNDGTVDAYVGPQAYVSNSFGLGTSGAYPIAFVTNSNERMRIDTSGNLLVGTTSQIGTAAVSIVGTTGSLGLISGRQTTNTAGKYYNWGPSPDASPYWIVYNQNNVGVYVAPGGNSWTAGSDETIKENLKPIENSLNSVLSLRAVIGNYTTDPEKTKHPFLIAQDVQKVLPEAVSIGPDGKLGLQYTDIIPLLTAAIQELKAIIDTQNARIEALEAK